MNVGMNGSMCYLLFFFNLLFLAIFLLLYIYFIDNGQEVN